MSTVPNVPVIPVADKKSTEAAAPELIGVKVVFTYRTPQGMFQSYQEIDSSNEIDSHSIAIEKKVEKKRDPETKDIIGFEDTGERTLSLKVKFHVK